MVILLVKKYPQYKIVNFDKLDYCSSLKNLASVETCPNYSFVRVRGACGGVAPARWQSLGSAGNATTGRGV